MVERSISCTSSGRSGFGSIDTRLWDNLSSDLSGCSMKNVCGWMDLTKHGPEVV